MDNLALTHMPIAKTGMLIRKSVADVFEIMQLPISEEVEAELMKQVRAIIAEQDAAGL